MFLKKPSTSLNFYKPILAALALVTCAANGQTAWIDSQRNGNEARFLFGGQIQRYDLAAKAWLPSITLPRTGATAMAADGQGAAVAYGATIYRYATDFTNEAAIGSTSSAIQSLFFDGNLLIAVHSSGLYARITIFNRTTGTQLSTKETYVDSMYGASHAPESNRLYGRTQGISPADIVTTSYTDAGVVSNVTSSPYHGDYPNATKTWVFPNEARVLDSSGTVYAAPGLTYVGTFAGGVIDIAFNGDVPIVLRNAELAAFGSNLLEAGRGAVTTSSTSKLYVTANEAFVFSPASGSPGVQIVSLSSLNAPQPGEPINPNGLPYAVDNAFLDKDGNLLLFSKAQLSLFRWSPAEREYTGSFPLIGVPDYAAYSTENHSAYFAYASQTVRKMDLGAATPQETPLFAMPQKPSGLATAGEFIFAADPSGAWSSHYVYSPAGPLIQSVDWNYDSRVWEWDPVKRRMYFFRDSQSPNDLHYETIDATGKITGEGETPYHGDFTVTPPIRVSPDGSKVVIGSGVVFETTGLTKTANLANGFTDAVWAAGKLVTLREISGVSQLQVWEGDQFLPGSTVRQFNGTPLRLFNTAQGLLLVTSAEGNPRFILLDSAFNPVFISPTRPAAPSNLTSVGRTVDSVSLQWVDNSDNEDSFRVEYRIGAGTWSTATTAGAGVTSTTVTGLPANTTFEFRVLAVTGMLDSTPSSSVTVRTLSSPDEPAGEPYNLRITRIFRNSITLEWQDNGDNETGFRILRSTTAGGATTVFNAPAGATSFTITGLAASTVYYFRIQIENGAITGDLSSQVSATTRSTDATPSQPSSLTVSALSPTSVSLKWTDASTNEDGFKIERSTNPVTVWTALATVPYNTAAFTDTTATPDTKYTYRVAAFNGTGTSSYRTVTTTTPALGGVFTGFAMRSGDVQYFAFSGPDRIERYDLVSRMWLPSVPLNATATALWVDESAIFVAEDRAVVRFSLAGGERTSLGNAQSTVRNLFTLKDVLAFAPSDGNYVTLDKTTGIFFSNFNYWYSGGGFSVFPNLNRVYFRSTSVSPSDIHYLEFDAAGKFITGKDSPYHGTYPSASRTFVFPNGARVADDSGTVYSTDSLAYNNSLAGSFTDLAFHGADIPIVLRGDKLFAYTNSLLETGSLTLTAAGLRVAVDAQDAVVFIADGTNPRGLRVQSVPLSSLNAPQPGQSIDPNGLPYVIDDAFVDKDGNLLLFSKAQLSLFRWSPAERGYTGGFPLIGAPDYAAYSAQNHSAYFAYASQTVRKMDLGAATPQETPFCNLPGPPRGFTMAGEFAYVATGNGLMTFSPAGENITKTGFTYYYGNHNTWDPVKRRVYHFRDGISPNDLHFDTISSSGAITGGGDTPYHGDFTAIPPVRVSPDGSKVVIGSGVVFNADGLTKTANLSNGFTDAVWTAGKLVTLREINGVSQLQVWEGDQFLPGATVRQFNGTPVRLFDTTEGLLLVTSVEGTPRFTLLDDAFNPVFISPTRPVAPANLTAIGRTVDSVSLQWTDNSDNEDSFRVEYRVGTGTWNTGSTAGAGVTSTTITGLTANTTFEFRVLAVTGTLESTPSSSVTARTLSSPDEPVGEPYNLRITRIFRNSITLEWQDNGDNETGFRILRSTTAGGAATVFTAPAGATSFNSTGLAASTTYYFRIQIENGAVTGDLSSQVSGTTRSSDAAPSQPSSLTVSALSPTSVSLKWTDASTNEDGFNIERSSNPTTVWTSLGSVPYNTENFTDTTATPDTKYTYRVAAFNSTGSSSYRSVTATTPALGGTFTGFAMRSGDVHYFAFSGPDRIERYDLVARSWLQAIPLNANATALWVDESAIFVAEDRSVVRFSLAGADRTPMGNAQSTVKSLFTLKNVLAFAPSDGSFVTLNKTTGIFLSNFSYWYSGAGFSAAPDLNRVFFRSTSVSPSDIHYLEFDASGKFVVGKDSPYHGAYPSASRTFVFPNGARVADDSGTVYSTDSLAYTNSLAGSFTDLAFHGTDIPIVLRGDKLVSYTNTLLEAGNFMLSAAGLRVAVDAKDAVVFIADGTNPRGLRVETVPLSQLSAPEPGEPVDPNGLPYAIDDVFVDKDGNLLLFSKAQLSLFRWSPSERNYNGSFPLVGVPDYAAYSAENHSAYFAYASQIVRKMDLGVVDPVETPFFSLPQKPSGLATAGEFIFAADPSGAWSSHYVFSPTGAMLQSIEWNYYSRVWEWDPVKRRMYFFRDDTSPNDLHYETIDATGKITGEGETPYHGGFTIAPPIRVSPDGSKVVIGSGVVFNADGLTKFGTTVPAFTDALWWNQKLLTLHASGTRTQIRRWDAATLVEMAALPLVSGTPTRLLAIDSTNLALITMEKGVPRIQILNQNLEVVHTFISTPTAVEDTPFAWTPSFEWSTLGTGSISVSAPVLPAWLSFSNGVLSGTPLEADSGDQVNRSESHRVVLRAVNAQNQTEERDFLITALWRNDPPVLPETTPRIAANDKGEDIQAGMGIFLADPDEKDAHHWEILENSNPGIFSDLRINDSGLLDIVFAPYASGTSTVAIMVTDAAGASAQTTFDINLPELPTPRVTIDSEPILSRLTGLYEQKITVTNVAARAIAGFDLFISGLRAGVSLYNGSSSGEGGGSIAYHQPMKAGESVSLVIEYFASPRGTVPTPLISAGVNTPEARTLAASQEETPGFAVNRLVKQSDGSVVIEFNAVPGKYYRVHYSADVGNWKPCPVAIQAGGTKVQWIDRGPPWTDSNPSTAPRRFYRVQCLDN